MTDTDLRVLVQRQMQQAIDAGAAHIRNPSAFLSHLTDVASRAERVATRLRDIVPADEAPDPLAAFVAGAWHDGGKIRGGDDFHEVGSAADVVERGIEWGMLRGPVERVQPLLRRAALAILPGFALYEQWQPDYRPTTTRRAAFEPTFSSLGLSQRDLLPHTLDALVVMYCDLCRHDERGAPLPVFNDDFSGRWRDLEERSPGEDPGLAAVLPTVRGRIYEGCAVINRCLTEGYDPAGLAAFRKNLPGTAMPPGDRRGPAGR